MKLNAEKILLSLIAFLASVGTKIAFDANTELKKLNDNLQKVTIYSELNKKELIELNDKLESLIKSSMHNHLLNRDKIQKNEKDIAVVERWCRKWKDQLDSLH